ncbi:MAG: hypothetical protein AAB553_05135 [Patescibacteria group bacterium]
MQIFDDFKGKADPHWTQVTRGGGTLQFSKSILRMGFPSAKQGAYTDAQIDDYTMLARSDYLWKPPLCMTVRAHSSHPAATAQSTEKSNNILRGTAGFGFWNKPFSMEGKVFTLPEAIWFFYSAPPSNMALVPGVPGWGWKAQVIHAMRPGAILQSIPLALTMGLGRLTGNTKMASSSLQRFAGSHDKHITEDMTQWHTYVIEWRKNESLFYIDDKLTLHVPQSPTRPLGFVAWLDNAYAIATPRGEFIFGKGKSGAEWLEMDSVKIEPLEEGETI